MLHSVSGFVSQWVNTVYVSIVFSKPVQFSFAHDWQSWTSVRALCECSITLLIGCSRLSCDAFQLRHFWVRVFFFLIIALITGIIRFFLLPQLQTHMLADTGTCSHTFLCHPSVCDDVLFKKKKAVEEVTKQRSTVRSKI